MAEEKRVVESPSVISRLKAPPLFTPAADPDEETGRGYYADDPRDCGLACPPSYTLVLLHSRPRSVAIASMSSLASQLVLHPYVSQSIKYGATNLGRDKVCPLLHLSFL